MAVALLGLVVAAVPGIVRLVPASTTPEIERPPAWASEEPAVELGSEVALRAGSGPADEVAIIPPEELVGTVAPAAPPPPLYRDVSTGPGQVYSLVIGIDDYPGSRHDLRSAVADADTVDAALLGFGVPDANRVVLRDGQATRAQVVTAVQALAAQSSRGSTLVLAYAGHVRKLAPRTEALVTADGGLITDLELAALLEPIRDSQLWVLLATCFAGGFTEILAPGRILTGAAGPYELAYESPSLNASYLVHYLVREGWLRSQAGASVQDAFAYADQRLAEEHPHRRPIQVDQVGRPVVLGSGDPSTAAHRAPQEPAPPPAPPPSAPPPTTTTTAPPKKCLLVVVCGSR